MNREREVGPVVIPPYIMADDNLSLTLKVLWGKINGLTGKTGYCFASNEWLAASLGRSKGTVKNNINTLVNDGYLERNFEGPGVKGRRLWPVHPGMKSCQDGHENVPAILISNDLSNMGESVDKTSLAALTNAYAKIKGVSPQGSEWIPHQKKFKEILLDRPDCVDSAIELMEALEASTETWTKNWTPHTVKTKLPEYIAGKLSLAGRNGKPAASNPHAEIAAQQERLRTLWNECSHNIKEVEDEAKRHNRSLTLEEHSQIAEIQDKQRDYEERGLRLKERLEGLC